MNGGERDDDLDAFREAVGDVQPLNRTPRDGSRPPPEVTPGLEHRRIAAEREPTAEEVDARLTLGEVPQVAPAEVVEFKRDGIQDGVFTKLRQGRYPIEARLDLHRKTVKEARAEVLRFVGVARARDQRSVLISHGRGERSPTPARIKSYVVHWLSQMDEVLAFVSAERRDGGAGSVYVLLRKSAKAREINRERHGQKSSG